MYDMVFFISARSVQNSEFANNAFENCVYFGMDYTFPVLFYILQRIIVLKLHIF
jgi:hypothetical protein